MSSLRLWIYSCLIISALAQQKANTHECVRATRKIANRGDGTTVNSCMSCDPTYGVCPDGCQNKIDKMYYACDGVCLPDGYFFDPPKELEGCWDDVLWHVKIAVERCGCNSGSRLVGPVSYIIAFSFALAVVLVR